MDSKELLCEIEKLENEFINIWQDVANIESPSDFKEGLDRVVEYISDYSKKQGFEVQLFEEKIGGNALCVTLNKDAHKKPITLAGHIDTVHPVGSFGTPTVKIQDEKIFGPGVMDCKGGVVAALMAMTALKNCGFCDRPIQLILDSDEETNGSLTDKRIINYIIEKAKGSEAFLNCESSRGNTAVLLRKGVRRYRCDVTGKSIHASRCAEGGASAILEAAMKICELEKLKDKDGLICNCGLISGGTSANTVPDFCSFTAEVRFANSQQFETGEKILTEVVNTSFVEGTKCTMTIVSDRPAMEKAQRNYDLLDKMNEIYRNCGLPELSARLSLGGSDAAEATVAGIPCVDSIAVAGDFIHTPKEYAVLSSLKESAKRIATVCAYL